MSQSTAAPHRILIVEDDPDSAESLELLLKMAGHTVHVAHDGDSALRAAAEFLPHVLLCDLGLPGGVSGHAVATTLRDDAQFAAVLRIAITGRSGSQDERQARQAGFDAFLTKPVTWKALESILRSMPQ